LKHESYELGEGSFPNDIAIITLQVAINTASAHIEVLTLPPDNTEQFVGITSSSNTLPDALQKVDIPVISTDECNLRMTTVIGADCTDGHIAVYDASEDKGSCNGDSGGPMNCPLSGQSVVAGVTSWGISGGGACLPEYPSVYTRTGFYLDWIILNTPQL
jgi:secreted trypsin-like serine protease